MNAGMYGMSDGRGMAGRKLIGRAGLGTLPATSSWSALASSVGAATAGISLTAGVRTRLLNINGAGALRFGLVNNGSGVGTSSTFEVWLDGVPFINNSQVSPNWSNGQAQVFAGSTANGFLDYLPFSQSCEVFVTAGTTSAGYTLAYLADLHQ